MINMGYNGNISYIITIVHTIDLYSFFKHFSEGIHGFFRAKQGFIPLFPGHKRICHLWFYTWKLLPDITLIAGFPGAG
jgi:hypothetical protein